VPGIPLELAVAIICNADHARKRFIGKIAEPLLNKKFQFGMIR